MVFDKYNKQFPSKQATGSETPKPTEGAPSSSYLSRLAGQAGAGGPSGPVRPGSGYGGNSQIWSGSTQSAADKNVRSSIEKRLHWVETAFKKGEEKQPADSTRTVVSSVRNRINALLTYDLPPRVRSELELIDRELNKIL